MADIKKIIGLLVILIAATSIYVTFNNNLRIRVDNDKSTFYVLENNRWLVSGREYNKLYDGSKLVYRKTAGIKLDNYEQDGLFYITRTTPFSSGAVIKDTYSFQGTDKSVELFPVSHTVEIFNASGKFYRYEVRDLVYDGPTVKLETTQMSFGKNMKVEWSPGYNWAWVYKSSILKVQYKIKSDYEVFDVRLFDPVTLSLCYQEDANRTTSCRAVANSDTYAYVATGTWGLLSKAYDGNWSSEMIIGDFAMDNQAVAGGSNLYINYTKPKLVRSDSVYQYKRGTNVGTIVTYNTTIPIDCFNYYPNSVYFRFFSWGNNLGTPKWNGTLFCYNGNWKIIDSQSASGADDYSTRIYEEAMWWNISSCPSDMEGDNTLASPCMITNCTQLQNMTLDLTGHYALNNSFDCIATNSWNGNTGFMPIGNLSNKFSGSLDGRNNTISNMFINDSAYFVSLLGYVDGANVTNLGLINISFHTTTNGAGGIWADASSTSYISRSFVTGNIIGQQTIGMIAGSDAVIDDCYANGTINGTSGIGGISGILSQISDRVNNSYSDVNITCSSICGGVTGFLSHSSSKVVNSFTSGSVMNVSSSQIGAIVGLNSGTITNSYWYNYTNILRCASNSGETGCTATLNNSYYQHNVYPDNQPMSQWDFYGVWQEREFDYPSLTWQGIGGLVYDWCYQEFANATTTCGGLLTGTYNWTGEWNSTPGNATDGNWSTFAVGPSTDQSPNLGEMYFNYTKPYGAVNTSLIQVYYYDSDDALYYLSNFTIPTSCWSQSRLSFKWSASYDMASNFTCFDGSDYSQVLWQQTSTWSQIIEEAMWWANASLEPVDLAPDTLVNYSCGNTRLPFRITNLTGQNVEPTTQNVSCPAYNITNNGTNSGNALKAWLNQSLSAGIYMECSTTYSDPSSVDTCESISGWTAGNSLTQVTLNSVTYHNGSAAINLNKISGGHAIIVYITLPSAHNIGNGEVSLWIYVKNQTIVDNITNGILQNFFLLGSDTANYYIWELPKTFDIGWNLINNLTLVNGSSVGNPDMANADTARFIISAEYSSVWPDGSFIIDDINLNGTYINLTTTEQVLYNSTIDIADSTGVYCRINLDNPTVGGLGQVMFNITS